MSITPLKVDDSEILFLAVSCIESFGELCEHFKFKMDSGSWTNLDENSGVPNESLWLIICSERHYPPQKVGLNYEEKNPVLFS